MSSRNIKRIALLGSPESSPQNMGNLELWLDAASGITLNGSTVSAWADQSGKGRNFGQSTAANQPNYITDSAIGKPAIEFLGNASSMHLKPVSALALSTNTLTVGFVLKRNVVVAQSGMFNLFDFAHDFQGNGATTHYENTGTTVEWYRTTNGSIAPHPGNGIIHSVINVWNGSTSQLYLNGVAYNPVASTGSFVINDSRIGTRYFSSANTNYYNGKIYEIAVFSKPLSGTEVGGLHSYFRKKFSI